VTRLEFELRGAQLRIVQDGRELARTTVEGAAGELLKNRGQLRPVEWKQGIYGPFGGDSLTGQVLE
jgi:hypothetical protein